MSQAGEWRGSAKAEEESLQRLSAALDHGVVILRGRRIVWANQRLVEMTGRGSPAGLVEADLGELLVDSGRGLPDPAVGPGPVECVLRHADGLERKVICRLVWPEIGPSRDAWVIEPATRARDLEQEILRLSLDLHRANRDLASLRDRLECEHAERDHLIDVMSHELRTPVTVIGGYHRLLLAEEAGPLTDEQRRFLLESAKSCRRLAAFIDHLSEASRQPKGGEIIEVCSGSLARVIEEAVDSLRPLLDERGLEVRMAVADDARQARFDPRRIEQVLLNLLGNAIRYAPRGGVVEIATAARACPETGRPLVEVAVCDDGPGVAPVDCERIFEPYVQVGEAERTGGLGLGLAICKRVVEGHGGTIGVSERPGGGSRFTFTLPTAEPPGREG
jgi:signal transduction histidine kinase